MPSKSIRAVAAIALAPGDRTYLIAASRLGGPAKARQIAPNRRKQAQAPRRRTRPACSWPASVSLAPLLHSYCNLSPEFESLSRSRHASLSLLEIRHLASCEFAVPLSQQLDRGGHAHAKRNRALLCHFLPPVSGKRSRYRLTCRARHGRTVRVLNQPL